MANKVMFVPLLLSTLFPATLITTYTMALANGHINPFFSYISDTGTTSPESCWFALLLNLTALIMGFVVYIRYKQIDEYFREKSSIWMGLINTFAMILGLFTSFGISMVGAFELKDSLDMHILAAFLAFLGGAFYFIFQAFFTFKMLPMFTNKFIAIVRLIIGISCVILFIVVYIAGTQSFKGFLGSDWSKWDRSEPNWNLRALSVTSEWILAALFDLYCLSFMLDFSKINFKSPQVQLYV